MREKWNWLLLRRVSVSLVIALVLCMLPVWQQTLMAGVWDNAYSYFQRYENDVVFHPGSSTDGEIFYATKAAKGTTSTRYRTIGWKVSIQNMSGSTLQTIYFKLGGSYMYKTDVTTKSNYEYNLYVLPLGNLKRRMNDTALNAMRKGNIRIVLNACMVVVKNGKPKGAMNDNGPTSGTVYTTYSGIAGAAGWSSSAKQSLNNYFDKNVQGLFYGVQTHAGVGIKSVSGAGEYCYGTYVTLRAKTESGFDFDQWQGSGRSASAEMSICVNGNQSWTAIARPKELTIVFHRNKSSGDTVTAYQKVEYGKDDLRFVDTGWNGDGSMLGWALSPQAATKDYSVSNAIRGAWIIKHSPKVDLYAVWKEPDPTPPNPTPPNPTPPNPTPPNPTPPNPTPPDSTPPNPTPPDPTPPNPTPTDPTPTDPTPTDPTPTDPEEPEPAAQPIKCRFISWKYFEDESRNLVPETKGGLAENCRWATDQSLREILRQALWSRI